MRTKLLAKLCVLTAIMCCPVSAADAADVVLSGRIDGSAHERYIELPFDVPAGTGRITVAFDYSGREARTTIDLGLIDPQGIRGWSGGNKRMFTVADDDATPSYRAGPLAAGRWHLLLGVPNIRRGVVSDYTARIEFTPRDTLDLLPAALQPVLREGPAWYRGDLHMHSAHSDASCPSQAGVRVPCPLFLSLQAASERQLDFVAVTEHNTASHLMELRGLQPYFDRLLLIPGMEVTTFQGHANVFGLQAALDFRVGDSVRDWNALLAEVGRRGLPLSVNHPAMPSDERCMGCGWNPAGGTDWSKVASVEVVNGGDAGTPVSGIPFWHARLDEGHRLTGVGGSDNHDASLHDSTLGRSRIGAPTTVVHARSLSQQAILDGIRSGRVFIDLDGGGAALDLSARHGDTTAVMGGDLALPAGAEAEFELQVSGAQGARVELIVDGRIEALLADTDVATPAQTFRWRWRSDGARHWLRADVRADDGRLLLVGNPVYVNFPAP